jgi:hypothetical protein
MLVVEREAECHSSLTSFFRFTHQLKTVKGRPAWLRDSLAP